VEIQDKPLHFTGAWGGRGQGKLERETGKLSALRPAIASAIPMTPEAHRR